MTINDNSISSPFLIIGLGNPGREYKQNRHNIGFMLVDRLADLLGVSFSRLECRALVTKGGYRDQSLILAKPQTFMNLSGQSAGPLLRFYKIPLEKFLVIYDDIDLPFGLLRLRPSGGSAGHKGMISLINRLGSHDFPRLRLGVGRPPGHMDPAAYVLQDFSRLEAEIMPQFLDRAVGAVLTFVGEGIVVAMNSFNISQDNDPKNLNNHGH